MIDHDFKITCCKTLVDLQNKGNGCFDSANTAGVFHLRAPEGKYKMTFSAADAACQEEGAKLASFKQLGDAQQVKLPPEEYFPEISDQSGIDIYINTCEVLNL